MSWKVRRVNELPSVTEPDTIYFVRDASDPTIATQWVTGADGSPRLAGGPGLDGQPGQGVPTGGAPGQVLAKSGPGNFATHWVDVSASAAWDDVIGKPATFPPSAHNQAISTITGLQAALDGKASIAQGALADTALQPGDSIPWTDVSDKPSFFSGAYGDLSGIPATFPPAAHGHDVATTAAAGFMSAADKAKLDNIASGATGTATLAFGAAPGTNVVIATVTGQTGIAAGASIKAWIAADSTADHNAYEHAVIFPGRIGLACGDVINGVGFSIYASTELRLTGNVACRWEWS